MHTEGKLGKRLGQQEVVYTVRESWKNRLGLCEDLLTWREN